MSARDAISLLHVMGSATPRRAHASLAHGAPRLGDAPGARHLEPPHDAVEVEGVAARVELQHASAKRIEADGAHIARFWTSLHVARVIPDQLLCSSRTRNPGLDDVEVPPQAL